MYLFQLIDLFQLIGQVTYYVFLACIFFQLIEKDTDGSHESPDTLCHKSSGSSASD